MPDIRLVPVTSPIVTMDWLLSPLTGAIEEGADLAAAVNIALMSDALASPSDALPDPNNDDRRGWWGDEDAQLIWGGWPLGSKLWLLRRAKITDSGAREGAIVARVQAYITACLQPFVDNKICSRFAVTVNQASAQRIDAKVLLYRGPKTAIELEYQALWSQLGPGVKQRSQ
ncbi:MAG: phage GP46 family protein [Gemmataceae bacterium]